MTLLPGALKGILVRDRKTLKITQQFLFVTCSQCTQKLMSKKTLRRVPEAKAMEVVAGRGRWSDMGDGDGIYHICIYAYMNFYISSICL